MAWRIANVSVSSSSTPPAGGTWKLAKVSVAVGGAWRIAGVSVVGTTGPASVWHLVRVSVAQAAKWSLAKVSVTSSAAPTAPTLSAPTTLTVDPVAPATITVTETSGIVPDSWSFTSPGITFTNVGGVATFSPPGARAGATLTVTVTATKGAQTSSPVTITVTVNPAQDFYRAQDGTLKAMSYPQYVKGS